MDKVIGKEMIAATMSKVLRISKPALFHDYGPNMYTITFATHADKQRVLEGKLWLFDNSVLVLKAFNGFTQSSKINSKSEEFWIQLHNLVLAFMYKECGE